MCLTSKGVFTGSEVTSRASKSPFKYCSSADTSILTKDSDIVSRIASNKLNELSEGDIGLMSCEAWVNDLHSLAKLKFISELKDQCTFVILVRAPISWINSAYWQWGAWMSALQHDWIMRASKRARWVVKLRQIRELFPFARLKVIPMVSGEDSVRAFFMELGLESALSKGLKIIRNNVSLPLDIIHLYHRFPELRPGPHTSRVDFYVAEAISKKTRELLPGSPWGLTHEELVRIHNVLKPENEALATEFLDTENSQRIERDSKWSSVSDYIHRPHVSSDYLRKTPAFGSTTAEAMIKDIVVALRDKYDSLYCWKNP